MSELKTYTKQQLLDNLYWYKALVTRIVDADTIIVDVDKGFDDWRKGLVLRLSRIDAPEKRGAEKEEGLAALDWLTQQLNVGDQIILKTLEDDSFGRYIAEVFLLPEVVTDTSTNLSDALVKVGHAEYRDY